MLKRDGTSVVTDSSCYPTSGSWYSPYDGATWYAASDVDIDHVVPLANPQLIAVTDNVNQSKGDQSPATWKPSRMWIRVKYRYSLTITATEEDQLYRMLSYC